ncbi:sulfur carrier protein ThiS [Gordonia sp. HNM0687]|uniref:Sulfur carrier protein ThiS n=1 Tax=Gordonia mangrovi TaxID=2665643 RepID=A0A6L7GUV5_9ACTN|nr:sulfur carrier protein ThiS [Gordonia mangrovi]MDY6810074.1 sulfur carrier protein ThiS [Actinomycetota bacterium]MXP23670.1 sulfur carrier protein ThiS [Gordonia mangrovi]UVF80642.1 sulfur carrier protein ThiS [Gordonia mangrovi]
MTVTVNGEVTDLRTDASVADLVTAMGLPDRGIAVAVDGVVVPRGSWGRALRAGAGIEIVTAVQGG